VFNYYKLSSIGKPSNQEIEIFQLFNEEDYPELEDKYATVGWVGVGNMSNNVFVPYFPMLIDDVYDAYQESTKVVNKLDASANAMPEGFGTWASRRGVNTYVEYPENWRDSYYFTFEGLGGYILYAENLLGAPLSDSVKAHVLDEMAELQQELYADFVTVDELKAAEDERALATSNGIAMAEKAHKKGLEMVDYVLAAAAEMTETYRDVATDAAIAEAVEYVSENGLMVGVADDLFAPHMTLDRAQMVQILWAKEGKPEAAAEAFSDVAADAWYADAVNWAASKGFVAGVGDGKFAPDADLTVEQVAVILYSYVGKPEAKEIAIEGASEWANAAMSWAVGSGVVAEDLAPQAVVTRANMAQILLNLSKI